MIKPAELIVDLNWSAMAFNGSSQAIPVVENSPPPMVLPHAIPIYIRMIPITKSVILMSIFLISIKTTRATDTIAAIYIIAVSILSSVLPQDAAYFH